MDTDITAQSCAWRVGGEEEEGLAGEGREGQERRATARFISWRPVAGCCRIDIDERAAGWADEMQRGSVERVQWGERQRATYHVFLERMICKGAYPPFVAEGHGVHCCEPRSTYSEVS